MEETNGNVRIRWREDCIKCFLETCVEEVTKIGKNGSSLQKPSWMRVQKQLQEVCDLKVSQKQMKNEYDYLKAKYAAWVYVKGKMGDHYNPKTNTFNLTNQEWKDILKEYPKAKTLKSSPLIFPDLCTALFKRTSGIGENRWSPSSNLPRSRGSSQFINSLNIQPLQMVGTLSDTQVDETQIPKSPSIQPLRIEYIPNNNNSDNNDNDNDDQKGGNENPNIPCSQSDTSVPAADKEKSATNSNIKEKRPKKKRKMSTKFSKLEEDMSSALKAIVKSYDGPSHEECVEKLNQIGWDTSSSCYVAALGIFCEGSSYRKGWMLLPIDNVELLKSWVVSVGRKFGYL